MKMVPKNCKDSYIWKCKTPCRTSARLFFNITFYPVHMDEIHTQVCTRSENETDESKFCHRRKYARGRIGNTWRRRTWVFGILEIRGVSRRPVLRLVKRRNKQTLLPIIKQHETIPNMLKGYGTPINMRFGVFEETEMKGP
ncbi:hypothetical protein AOLI_G00084460 [Acnodon oligacanthus]